MPLSRNSITRRNLVQGAALTSAAMMVGTPAAVARDGSAAAGPPGGGAGTEGEGGGLLNFDEGSAALQPDRTVRSACQFCNSNCSLTVGVRNGRVVSVGSGAGDPVQNGNLCVKAPMMAELVHNPRRLTRPLIRTGGRKGSKDSTFREASWEEALDLVARRLLRLRDKGEAAAIANRTSGRLPRGTGSLVARLFALLGSPNNTDVGPVCNDAGGNALAATFGLGNFTNGYGTDGATGKDDLGSAGYFLLLGTNQAETHPVTFDYLLRGRTRTGAKLVVVDPRKTATGAVADEWIAPKPHTDLALVLGMLHHVLDRDLHDREFVKRWVLGFDELRTHLRESGYTPEWAARITGVPADTIRRLAREYAGAGTAAIFCNAGISHQLGAFDTYRVLTFLAAVTGNIGKLGAGCNFMHNTWPGDLRLPELTVRTPALSQALPVGPDHFADAILTGTPYPLKAVITQGNPLVSSANTEKVKEAYRKLEFYVYTGLFMEEAAYYADVVLPVSSPLEYDGVYMRRDDRAIRWQEAAVERCGDSRPDWEIWIDLAHAMARHDGKEPPSYWTGAFPEAWKDYSTLWAEFVAHTPGMGGMTEARMRERDEPLRWPCPAPEHPGVSALYQDHPSWYEAAEALGAAEGRRFLTPSGKVEIHTPELDRRLAVAGHSALPVFYTHPEVTGGHPTLSYEDRFVTSPINPQAVTRPVKLGVEGDGTVHRDYPLMGMTGRPSVAHFATVTHWTPTGARLNGIRFLQIHPDTARKLGIEDRDEVVVESPRGKVTATALYWPGIRRDTIFVPNTFGPAQELAQELGGDRYEAVNTLVDDRYYDNLSGQQAYKCFACKVTKAPA
ncbi:molybdopterin-containing oxidoreductase family protein [Streptomyces abyssomicinicus]|uniref:molybdopterin-containing oxidoreductase family protein n=1 Tax=Streptomyces abyssomicinicus TaxID=574929 RepID=UPI0013E07FA1|nr:molybdopterin-dependent oxidoreductase [Streptomyces abyssomicinicus]